MICDSGKPTGESRRAWSLYAADVAAARNRDSGKPTSKSADPTPHPNHEGCTDGGDPGPCDCWCHRNRDSGKPTSKSADSGKAVGGMENSTP